MTLHVARVGRGAEAALLLHGGLSRSERLMPLAGALADRMTMVVPDLPGHGRSPDWDGQGDYHAACVEAVAPLAEAGMHLIGHSFGGTVALRLAIERPGMVSRLTLIEPVMFAAAGDTPAARDHEAGYAEVRAQIAAGNPAAAAEAFLALWGPGVWARMDRAARRDAARRMPLIEAAEAGIMGDSGAVVPRLRDLAVPVHLIRGSETHPVVADIHAGLMARLPDARETVIPGGGHMVTLTHPGEVAAMM
ncbi:alpha/beta fold hydrolase [Wenxinia marina]|uniref:Wenxma_17, whole genome shotgun sequence n=1 Tax=Wenxinia marina DSM 24838 TaxID=1123501 RepID=A0A0D0P8X8_9RHOB|nr:alpha/beta hydrolase [Wenxinia marina]KIQ68026.1 putative hydrolase or acyltransferase (alpha/beta hydrolase superfamily) [Wenxinia marina DSM 24838]GGL75298.1 alpha/beta hydrolase [Wenxinia marina]